MLLNSLAAYLPRRRAHHRLGVPCETTLCVICFAVLFLFSGNSGTTDTFLVASGSCHAILHTHASFSMRLTRGCGRLQQHCFLFFGNVKVTVPRSPLVRVRCISRFCQATSASRALWLKRPSAWPSSRPQLASLILCLRTLKKHTKKTCGVNALSSKYRLMFIFFLRRCSTIKPSLDLLIISFIEFLVLRLSQLARNAILGHEHCIAHCLLVSFDATGREC